MKEIIIKDYKELSKLKVIKEKSFIVNLSNCIISKKRRIIDVLCGSTLNGYIQKINKDMYKIII